MRSLAKSHSGVMLIGIWKGIGHDTQTLRPLMSSKEPDLPTQEASWWTGETELEPSNCPKRGAKPVQKTDEEIMHMSVQVCAWLIARVKGRWRSRQPLQDGKAWFRSHSSLQTLTRHQQLTLSLEAVFRHRSVPYFSCHQHSLSICGKYRDVSQKA